MAEEIKPPIVTEDDVLKGSKEVPVLMRDGSVKTIVVNAMSWRSALRANFSDMTTAMIHMLENCVEEEGRKLLDAVSPVHLGWLTNTIMQLSNGVEAVKKLKASLPPAGPGSPSSTQPNVS